MLLLGSKVVTLISVHLVLPLATLALLPPNPHHGKRWLWARTVLLAQGPSCIWCQIKLCRTHEHGAMASSKYVTCQTGLGGWEKRVPFYMDGLPDRTATHDELFRLHRARV